MLLPYQIEILRKLRSGVYLPHFRQSKSNWFTLNLLYHLMVGSKEHQRQYERRQATRATLAKAVEGVVSIEPHGT